MIWSDPGFHAIGKEAPQPFVFEALDHINSVTLSVTPLKTPNVKFSGWLRDLLERVRWASSSCIPNTNISVLEKKECSTLREGIRVKNN